MKFRLLHKKLGVKSIDVFSEFEYPNIRDIIFVKDIGFLCLCENALILVTAKECKQILSLNNPMSICNGMFNSVYILYSGGIKKINYKDNYYTTDLLSGAEYNNIFNRLIKIGVHDMYIDCYNDTVAICVSSLHKFFKLRKQSMDKEFGTGIPEYSLSNNITQCSFYSPQGILVYDLDTIFVADTGNGCIRSLGKNHRLITGKPTTYDISPTKLLIDRKKDLLYYLSKNYLRSVYVDGSRDALLYEGNNIVSAALTDDGKIYVLEKE